MSPKRAPERQGPAGFPRVSGDEPDTDAQSGGENTFSPRERG